MNKVEKLIKKQFKIIEKSSKKDVIINSIFIIKEKDSDKSSISVMISPEDKDKVKEILKNIISTLENDKFPDDITIKKPRWNN